MRIVTISSRVPMLIAVLLVHILTPITHAFVPTEQLLFSRSKSMSDEQILFGNRISRTTTNQIIAEYGTVRSVKLTVTANKHIKGSLVERVPYDSMINATGSSTIKRPELLSLQMPFRDNFPMSLEFGHVNPQDHLGMPYHDGADYAIPQGTEIVAVDEGEVIPYRKENSYGTTVAIQHTWGRSYYGHLSTSSAQIGDKVRKGDSIATSGNTGLSTGPHIHFTMIWGDENPIDPDPHIKRKSITNKSQKEIVWPIEMYPNETREFEYTYTLGAGYSDPKLISRFDFGPARLIDQSTSCLPDFVSKSLLTHYDVNAPKPANIEGAPHDVCPTLTTELDISTLYATEKSGITDAFEPAHQPTDTTHATHPIPSITQPLHIPDDAHFANITSDSGALPPREGTLFIKGVILWLDSDKHEVKGYDTLTNDTLSFELDKNKTASVIIDEQKHIILQDNNTLLLLSSDTLETIRKGSVQ